MNVATMIQMALGLFRTVQAEGIGGAAPAKKVRKIGYGDGLRAAITAKQLDALNRKRAKH